MTTAKLSLKALAAQRLAEWAEAERPSGTHQNTPVEARNPDTPERSSHPNSCSAFHGLGGGTLEHADDGYVSSSSEELLRPDVRPCWACGGTKWWTDRYGVHHCLVCHPEPSR